MTDQKDEALKRGRRLTLLTIVSGVAVALVAWVAVRATAWILNQPPLLRLAFATVVALAVGLMIARTVLDAGSVDN